MKRLLPLMGKMDFTSHAGDFLVFDRFSDLSMYLPAWCIKNIAAEGLVSPMHIQK